MILMPTKNGKKRSEAANEVEISNLLARALSSTNWHTRDEALQQILSALRVPKTLSQDNARKLWKGLFYNFWHSDKGPVQVFSTVLHCQAALSTLRVPCNPVQA